MTIITVSEAAEKGYGRPNLNNGTDPLQTSPPLSTQAKNLPKPSHGSKVNRLPPNTQAKVSSLQFMLSQAKVSMFWVKWTLNS